MRTYQDKCVKPMKSEFVNILLVYGAKFDTIQNRQTNKNEEGFAQKQTKYQKLTS